MPSNIQDRISQSLHANITPQVTQISHKQDAISSIQTRSTSQILQRINECEESASVFRNRMSSTLGESVSNSDNGIQAIQRFQERTSSAIEGLGTRFGDLAMAQSSSANQTVSTDIGLAFKSITHVPLKDFAVLWR
jgi:hypothetical protein